MESKKGLVILGTIGIVLVAIFTAGRVAESNQITNTEVISENTEMDLNDLFGDITGTETEEATSEEVTLATEEELTEIESEVKEEIESEVEEKTDVEVEEEKEESATYNIKDVYVYSNDYEIQSKDTLTSIATMCLNLNGVEHTEAAMIEAQDLIIGVNNIKDPNLIREGDAIVMPTMSNFTEVMGIGNAYKIQEGDTLYSIATTFLSGYDIEEAINMLIENNNLENANSIQTGATIYIPNN